MRSLLLLRPPGRTVRVAVSLATGACFAVLLSANGLWGGEAKETKKGDAFKAPSPVKALETAVKNLAKAKNYKVSVSILGGTSEREDHEVTEKNVDDSYDGEVYGSLMHVLEPKAYRTVTRGTALIDGGWRDILSDAKTVRLERFFVFPESILQKALLHAPKSAQWVKEKRLFGDLPIETEFEIAGEEPAEAAPEKPVVDSKDDPERGKTIVVNKPKPEPSAQELLAKYRVVRIEAPPEEAVKHFIQVQNSGCFGGG